MLETEIRLKLSDLPDELGRQVLDYADFLRQRYGGKATGERRFRFGWEGRLAEAAGEVAAVELQHKATEWR